MILLIFLLLTWTGSPALAARSAAASQRLRRMEQSADQRAQLQRQKQITKKPPAAPRQQEKKSTLPSVKDRLARFFARSKKSPTSRATSSKAKPLASTIGPARRQTNQTVAHKAAAQARQEEKRIEHVYTRGLNKAPAGGSSKQPEKQAVFSSLSTREANAVKTRGVDALGDMARAGKLTRTGAGDINDLAGKRLNVTGAQDISDLTKRAKQSHVQQASPTLDDLAKQAQKRGAQAEAPVSLETMLNKAREAKPKPVITEEMRIAGRTLRAERKAERTKQAAHRIKNASPEEKRLRSRLDERARLEATMNNPKKPITAQEQSRYQAQLKKLDEAILQQHHLAGGGKVTTLGLSGEHRSRLNILLQKEKGAKKKENARLDAQLEKLEAAKNREGISAQEKKSIEKDQAKLLKQKEELNLTRAEKDERKQAARMANQSRMMLIGNLASGVMNGQLGKYQGKMDQAAAEAAKRNKDVGSAAYSTGKHDEATQQYGISRTQATVDIADGPAKASRMQRSTKIAIGAAAGTGLAAGAGAGVAAATGAFDDTSDNQQDATKQTPPDESGQPPVGEGYPGQEEDTEALQGPADDQ